VGERCDDGNTADNDGCSARCIPEFCGDKIINNKNEECDDGNVFPDDGCTNCFRSAVVESEDEDDDQAASSPSLTPEEAFRLSLVTTLFLPPGLGLVWGPSMGHFAAGETGRAMGMTLLRAGLIGAAVGISRSQLFVANDPDFNPRAGTALIVIDGLALTTLIAVDLLDGPRAIERAKK
jgi:cysteine-rich repeat protein